MPIRPRLLLAVALAAATLDAPAVRAQEPALEKTARIEDAAALGVGRLVPDLELTPLRGDKTTLSTLLKGRKALVLAMTSVDCPLAVKYAPRLAAIEDEYAKAGIAFVFVNTAEADTPDEMTRQATKYRFDGPYLPDREGAVPAALAARTTTEVFILDPSRTLLFRDAVDDQHGVGSALPAPRNAFLRDALDATLAGTRPRVRATWPPGCLLDLPTPAHTATALAYYGRISRIMAANCVSCHRPGGPAPFELDSLKAVTGRAPMIEAVVQDGLMPPWHGAVRPPDSPDIWVTDRSMPAADRAALLEWLRSDRAQGDPADAPATPPTSNTWTIGRPDLLLSTANIRLPAEGGLLHERLAVAIAGTDDRWISAVEFRPVETDSVHHALVWILQPGDILPDPAAIPAGLELLGTYSPGDSILRYPPGTARLLRPGSMLLVDLYSMPMGKEGVAALRIAFRFTAEPKSRVRTLVVNAPHISPEPGASHAGGPNAPELTVPAGATILALTPTMQARGRVAVIEAILPDGEVRPLLNAPRYDFRWQIRYEFIEPERLPPGSRLILRGVHDHTEPDASGVAPAGPLRTGSCATDEALILAVDLLEPPKPPASGGGTP